MAKSEKKIKPKTLSEVSREITSELELGEIEPNTRVVVSPAPDADERQRDVDEWVLNQITPQIRPIIDEDPSDDDGPVIIGLMDSFEEVYDGAARGIKPDIVVTKGTAPDADYINIETVNSPDHYNQGSIETIDYLKSTLTKEEFAGFCKGNVLKYVSREAHKNGIEDLKKAQWYLNRLIQISEEEPAKH